MRICTDHWAQIHDALRTRGLPRAQKDQENGRDAGPSDEVLGVNASILHNFVDRAQPRELLGDSCPLCQVDFWRPGAGEVWISAACNQQLLRGAPDVG